jgi:preprotein translocase subunit SecG
MSSFIFGLISVIHVLTCIGLMATILLQSGKGGGLAGSFGGGTSQTLFGGRGAATFLSRGATILAVVFFLTSLTLGLSSSRTVGVGGRSLIQEEARQRARQGGEQATPTAPPLGGAPAPGTGLGTPPAGTPPATTPQATAPQTTTPRTTQQQAPSTTQQPPATAPSNTTTQPPASQEGTQAPEGDGTP